MLGERHPDYAMALISLGVLSWSEGDYAAARPLYEQALEVYRAGPGERHPDAISCLNNLGTLFYAKGDFVAARPLFERRLSFARKSLDDVIHWSP